jgi:small subunit ribosomal protein S11
MVYKRSVKAKDKKRNIACGVVHIRSTFNNTLVTLTDVQGNVLCWSSSGDAGFKGARKSTPYAAQLASESVCQKGKIFGLKSVEVCVKGPGSGRESALRALRGGFNVTSIRDVTPIPHNGCRLPKRRRA